jgi:hypothetical protein
MRSPKLFRHHRGRSIESGRDATNTIAIASVPYQEIHHASAVRVEFCIFALSENDGFSFHLDIIRVNGREPLPTLNAYADCVSNTPVLHQIELCAELQSTQGY